MPRPIPLKLVVKILKQKGFVFISQKGSHGKFRENGKLTKTVIVKMSHKEIPYGTFKSILLQAGLKENDFLEKK